MTIYNKKTSVGEFAKKEVDYKNGDKISLSNEGVKVDGQYGEQNVFLVKLANGSEKNLSLNQTSINGLIDAFGKDSKDWIGKELKVHLITQNVAGKFVKVTYVSHPEAELTENGFVLPSTQVSPEANINPDDIPF